ncbi:MAG: hypothetical protein JNJ45_08610 [Chthonomonas sp.]|nr:hypothetical protein [Chthonomonas sp.]
MYSNRKLTRAASLVEILVVIVVFLVGILGVAQVFPKGLGILRTTANNSVAVNLARAEIERLKGQSEQIAEAILPVQYAGGGLQLDLNQRPSAVIPAGTSTIRSSDGFIIVNGNALGPWHRFAGSNTVRRVLGEGKKIAQPRFVPVGTGAGVVDQFGSLMNLQFGPVLLPAGQRLAVYGPDMEKIFQDNARYASNSYLLDDDGQQIALPEGAVNREYRLEFNYIATSGSAFESRTLTTTVVIPGKLATPYGYVVVNLGSLPGVTNFAHAEQDTIRAQRMFTEVAPLANFSTTVADDSAFEYKLLDANLGTLMFNPNGYGYELRTRRARVPLSARVDYDVFDWRILREDLTGLTAGRPYRLAIRGLKVSGINGPDGLRNAGLGFTVNDGDTTPDDIAVIDLETGGIITPASYSIDKSEGILTFNATQQIVYAQSTTPQPITVDGRSLRAIYMARNEMAVQVSKAASVYVPTSSATIGFKQCYLGATNLAGDGLPYRIYFPLSDIGKKVAIGEVWYLDSGTNRQLVEDQTFVIQAPRATDWQALAYVDIREIRPDAAALDFSNGYAVRRVRGASVDVRVTWNPGSFQLRSATAPLSALETYMQQNRRSLTESFIVRGVDQ